MDSNNIYNYDLWTYLESACKPIVLYGMGNGADKIMSVCESRGIRIHGIFASDGFARGNLFHGMPVITYSQTREKYGDGSFIILLSFASSRPEVMEQIRRIASENELYVPDVPVFGDEIFDMDYYMENKNRLSETCALLYDEESREKLQNIIKFKLSGRIDYLETINHSKEIYEEILHAGNFTVSADLGAYNGDSIRELLPYAPRLEKIIALEPDAHSAKKLSEYSGTENRCNIEIHRACAWSHSGVIEFATGGSRNSGAVANVSYTVAGRIKKTADVPAVALDDILDGRRVDFIKYDVEGSEHEAISGSLRTIREYSPALLISVYHRSSDIFRLPQYIHSLCPSYRLYLRCSPYIPAWDVYLIAVRS